MGNGQWPMTNVFTTFTPGLFGLELLPSEKLFNSEPGKTDYDNNRQFPLVCSFGERKKINPKLKLLPIVIRSHCMCSLSGALTIKIGKLQTFVVYIRFASWKYKYIKSIFGKRKEERKESKNQFAHWSEFVS